MILENWHVKSISERSIHPPLQRLSTQQSGGLRLSNALIMYEACYIATSRWSVTRTESIFCVLFIHLCVQFRTWLVPNMERLLRYWRYVSGHNSRVCQRAFYNEIPWCCLKIWAELYDWDQKSHWYHICSFQYDLCHLLMFFHQFVSFDSKKLYIYYQRDQDPVT